VVVFPEQVQDSADAIVVESPGVLECSGSRFSGDGPARQRRYHAWTQCRARKIVSPAPIEADRWFTVEP
jgi:hypothetical protein